MLDEVVLGRTKVAGRGPLGVRKGVRSRWSYSAAVRPQPSGMIVLLAAGIASAAPDDLILPFVH